MQTILIASDHAGFELKETIKTFLLENNYRVEDKGAFTMNPEDDYPDFIIPLARLISGDSKLRGIIIGGSGAGEAISANRFPHVRAVVFYGGDMEIVKLSRQHNDSNVLSLGARFLDHKDALEAVNVWLTTPFDGGRHERRIKKIEDIK